jgi:hypothetical protein
MLSFYLGTGRPPQYQKEIAGMLVDADRVCGDHIVLSKLIHGVCYSLLRAAWRACLTHGIKRWQLITPSVRHSVAG